MTSLQNKASDPVATEINQLHGDIVDALTTSVAKAIRIGELLTTQKRELGHGRFLPWIKKHVAFTDRTARNYMKVYRERKRLATVDGLGRAYRLLAGPSNKTETLSDLDKLAEKINRAHRKGVEAELEYLRHFYNATIECFR